jgi:hypothetical protein
LAGGRGDEDEGNEADQDVAHAPLAQADQLQTFVDS